LFAQIDQEGNQYVIPDEIMDVEHNENITPALKSTKGWCLCVHWKDGSISWEQSKDMKHGFPNQTAE
jgi:hypothetical protein